MNGQKLEGMTINERLHTLGLMEKFDIAIRNRDSTESISVLLEAKFTKSQATDTVTEILQNPHRHGY